MAPEHNNNRFNNNWIQNYFFVDMPATESRYIYRDKRRDAAHQYSGMLKVRLVTVDPLFIGSGFQELEGTEEGMQFVKQSLEENGKPIIPGSGLKGAVRHICRAVSKSCVPQDSCRISLPRGTNLQCKPEKESYWLERATEEERAKWAKMKKAQKEAKLDHACIVCDMFGKMGWSSKVFFSDLVAESGKTEHFRAAQQFAPHPDAEKYLNGGCHRYKFYYTDIRKDDKNSPQRDLLRAVPPKTVFTGEITYRNLDQKELGLLLFGLGQSRTISLKLGGYRNEGFGTVNLTLASDEIDDPQALANEYIDSVDNAVYRSIEQLENGMSYQA